MRGVEQIHRRLARNGPASLGEWLVFLLLLPFSSVYRELMRLRAALYRWRILPSYKAPVPVISVGNLAVGGTGKTPVVDYLLKFYRSRGLRVAVVSRGYGGSKEGAVRLVCAGTGPLLGPEQCGDEPYLLAQRNPQALVLVAPRRAAGVRHAVEKLGAQLVLLDDGFQHLAVDRDLDIVLLDADRPLGNGRVLPAGLLREPISALSRGDVFLLTRCESGDRTLRPVPEPVLRCRHRLTDYAVDLRGESVALATLASKRGVAFAGLADPDNFFRALKASGLQLKAEISLPDHCPYGPAEMKLLARACADADYLITTEKDGVKLAEANLPLPCYRVPMAVEFQDPEALAEILIHFAGIDGKKP